MVGAASDLEASKVTILFARFPPFEPFGGAMVKSEGEQRNRIQNSVCTRSTSVFEILSDGMQFGAY